MKTAESVLPALNTQGHSLDRIYSLLWQDRCGWNKIPGEPRRELGTAGNLAQHCYEIQAVEGQAGCQQLLPCISLCTLPGTRSQGILGLPCISVCTLPMDTWLGNLGQSWLSLIGLVSNSARNIHSSHLWRDDPVSVGLLQLHSFNVLLFMGCC